MGINFALAHPAALSCGWTQPSARIIIRRMIETVPPLSIADRRAAGHARRALIARSAHADFVVPPHRIDPVAILKAQNGNRIAALVPLRTGRMAGDPVAFLRGAAAVMAADLAATPDTGLRAQLCGDAHLMNFGAAVGVTGDALFDVNDFDETLPGPFEWDVKRLAGSLAVAGRVQGLPDKACRALARRAVHSYRREIGQLAMVAPLDAWHSRVELNDAIEAISDRSARRHERQRLQNVLQSNQDGYRHLISANGSLHLPERPPAIFRLGTHEEIAHTAFAAYTEGLAEERRVLVRRYTLRDVAFKAVGVGSVGTFCAIGLYATPDGDTLLLQLKEAQASVLAPFAGASAYGQHGERVVVGQRIMQAEPDVFLGWAHSDGRAFYVRKLKDARLAAIGTEIEGELLPFYARLCGRTLARAHARGGDAAAIAGYLGCGDSFDAAIAHWSIGYADQTDRDFQRFRGAIAAGELESFTETRK